MQHDPHVRRSRDGVVDPVVGATWDFEPASRSDLDKEVADFCGYTFFECLPWTQFLATAMRAYIRDGFALFEETDGSASIPAARFPAHPGGGQGVVVTGLHYRPAWTVHAWGQSKRDASKLDYVDQYIVGSDGEQAGIYRLRANRVLRFSWEQEGAHFEGYPIFRSAWGPWMAKRLLMRIEMMSHERNHMAQPWVTGPEGMDITEAEANKILKIVSNFRAHENGGHFLPGGYSIDFKSGAANTPIQSTIDRLNLDIAINVAGQFQLLGSKGSSGSYALANTQEGQFRITLDKHARFIQDVMNNGMDGWSIVERIVRLNYGEGVEVPRLVARNMPTVNWKEVLPLLIDAKKAGLTKADLALDKFIRKVTYAPDIDDTTQAEYAETQPLPPTGQLGLFEGEHVEE